MNMDSHITHIHISIIWLKAGKNNLVYLHHTRFGSLPNDSERDDAIFIKSSLLLTGYHHYQQITSTNAALVHHCCMAHRVLPASADDQQDK